MYPHRGMKSRRFLLTNSLLEKLCVIIGELEWIIQLFGTRNVIGMHIFTLMSLGFGMRSHVSVIISTITENTSSNNSSTVYEWHNKNAILSSFNWGYVILQLVAALLARKHSPKILLMFAMTVNSLGCMAIPLGASIFGSYGVIACRILQGMAQGFFAPLSYIILAAWSPMPERSTLAASVLNGSIFGCFFTIAALQYLCTFSIGWPITFYIHGIIGLAWVGSWWFNGADSPAQHRRILKQERDLIEHSIDFEKDERLLVKPRTPWREILTSPAIWALIICHVGHNFGFIYVVTEIPNFIFNVLKYETNHRTMISSLPYNIALSLGAIFPCIADLIMTKRWMNRGATRKLFTTLGFVVPAVALLILSHLPINAKGSSIAALIIAFAFTSAANGGFFVSHIDLSSNHVGVLMALGNSMGNLVSIVAPYLLQFLMKDEDDMSSWRIIFIVSAMLYSVSAAVYLSFGSSTTQWWNKMKDSKETHAYIIPTDIIREGGGVTYSRTEET